MKNAIILHGKPDPGMKEYYNPNLPSTSNSNWLPWLQKQLIVRDIAAYTPEVPNAWKPHYPTWQKEFERYDITPETILVGHSCGAGFILRWLSEHRDVRVGKVVLVAPWLDPNRDDTTDFFDCELDVNLAERTGDITIFSSTNDYASIHKTVEIIRSTIKNVRYKEFKDYGHFCFKDMQTVEFPELLEEVS